MSGKDMDGLFWDGSKGCPHYEALLNRCLLSRGGVYVPVDDHVRQFCQGDLHTQCDIFLADGKMPEVKDPSRELSAADRRRHFRIPDRISMTLALMSVPGEEDSLLDDNAFTLDLSEGGMCLASHRALQVHSQLSFRFGHEFRQELLGVGQVRWCSSADDSPLFYAGMMFTDQRVSHAVGRYLALAA
ncbi:MAG: hypothetical protein BWK76_12610 [Desulfobulbaceae bacterium A2]|nr:MAG: hypothetical protein BWK76_12610 [Desulfobulbaceae bacterium A2]